MKGKYTIYLCLAHMSGNEQQYIRQAFDTNWVAPLGPNVDAFEQSLEDYINDGRHCRVTTSRPPSRVAAVSSGTAAIHLALKALGVGVGDEVMVQSFTFCASANPVVYLGATPVFVDSERDTWNMDPQLLDEAIAHRISKTGKKPKAIIPVSLYGMPYKVDEIMAVADKYAIPIVEDTAEALGTTYKGMHIGTFGEYGVMSFNGNKMITTSGGGAVICNGGRGHDAMSSEEQRANAVFFATQARQPLSYYEHMHVGFNYRMSNVCAGIGLGQMTVLHEHVEHHRAVHGKYLELLGKEAGISVKSAPDDTIDVDGRKISVYDSNYWLTTILLDGMDPEQMRQKLEAAGIESRPLWKPMHMQPVFKDAPAYVNGTSEELFHRGLCLPSGPMVSMEDVEYIVHAIKS